MTPGIFFTLEAKELEAFAIEDVPQFEWYNKECTFKNQCETDHKEFCGCNDCYVEDLKSCKAKAIQFAPEFLKIMMNELYSIHPRPDNKIDFTKIYPVPSDLKIEFKEEEYGHVDDYSKPHGFRKVAIITEVKREDKPKEEESSDKAFNKLVDKHADLYIENVLLREQLKAADEVIKAFQNEFYDQDQVILGAIEKYNSLKKNQQNRKDA